MAAEQEKAARTDGGGMRHMENEGSEAISEGFLEPSRSVHV
jgi:hypothetical protein